ncbi:MAG: tripartite tricarboxylate transporter TctB family protein [Proteobacteria bacterium]|nr:tripartite tricarboxylate transporter TctB family protein [Pseudomonadota bacterium]
MRAIATRLGREGVAGAFIAATGVTLWLLVRDYPFGELSEIGPGFVPFVASLGLVGLGAAMAARALMRGRDDGEAPRIGRGAVLVAGGMAVFAFGLEPLGLFVASALSVYVTSLAARDARLRERVVVALCLAALVTIVFGYALSMSLPLAPALLRP